MTPCSSLRTALLSLVSLVIAVAAVPAPAQVAEAPADVTVPADVAAPAIVPAEAPALFVAAPLAEDALARISGRENQPTWQTSNAQSSATVKDNSVGNNSPTGALSVSDSAFQNVSGISMVNLNTGNASSINATMNVNVSIQMAPVPGGM